MIVGVGGGQFLPASTPGQWGHLRRRRRREQGFRKEEPSHHHCNYVKGATLLCSSMHPSQLRIEVAWSRSDGEGTMI